MSLEIQAVKINVQNRSCRPRVMLLPQELLCPKITQNGHAPPHEPQGGALYENLGVKILKPRILNCRDVMAVEQLFVGRLSQFHHLGVFRSPSKVSTSSDIPVQAIIICKVWEQSEADQIYQTLMQLTRLVRCSRILGS